MVETLSLLAVNLFTVLQVWLVSLRRTVNLRSIALFFLIGLFGTTLATFVLHFLVTRFVNPAVVSYTINPFVEESVKVLPVILFVWLYRKARPNLGMLDIMLLALASGTGFEVGESLMYTLGQASRKYAWSLWLMQQTPYEPYYFSRLNKFLRFTFAGHGVMAAVIGLGIGMAMYLKQIPKLSKVAMALPLLILIWTIYDHAMANYLIGHRFIQMSRFLDTLYYYDRAGTLIIRFLTYSLLLGVLVEEILITKYLAAENTVRMPRENTGIVLLNETKLVVNKFRLGWEYIGGLLNLFALRRQLAYYKYFTRNKLSTTTVEHLRYLRLTIAARIGSLKALELQKGQNGWDLAKTWANISTRFVMKLKTINLNGWFSLLLISAWILLLVFQPAALKKQAWFYYLTLILAILGSARAIILYWRIWRAPKPDLNLMDANGAVGHFSAVSLANISIALVVSGLAAYFLPLVKIINDWHTYFLWNAFRNFYNKWGAYLPGMLGLSAGMLASITQWILNKYGWGTRMPVPDPAEVPDEVRQTIGKLFRYQTTVSNALYNPANLPHDGSTYCNMFVTEVARNMGYMDILDDNGNPLLASQQYSRISQSDRWREIGPREAQELANRGELVIGLSPVGNSGHGHSTVVAPGYSIAETGSGTVPWVYDANKINPFEPSTANLRYIYNDAAPHWFTTVLK